MRQPSPPSPSDLMPPSSSLLPLPFSVHNISSSLSPLSLLSLSFKISLQYKRNQKFVKRNRNLGSGRKSRILVVLLLLLFLLLKIRGIGMKMKDQWEDVEGFGQEGRYRGGSERILGVAYGVGQGGGNTIWIELSIIGVEAIC